MHRGADPGLSPAPPPPPEDPSTGAGEPLRGVAPERSGTVISGNRRGITALLISVALLAGCTAPTDPPPPQPPAVRSLLLGAAGAPQGTFGDPRAPDFPRGFAELANIGFDLFFPLFLVSEGGESTAEVTHFLPPVALPGLDPELTCAGPRNPWSGAGSVQILLPGYLLATDQADTELLDVPRYQARLRSFLEVCLGGDTRPLAGIYLQDEPANNYMAARLSPEPRDYVLENVATMAAASREIVQVPTVIAEAPLPFLLPFYGVSEADRPLLEELFHRAVRETVPAASVYGFSLYPVDLVPDLTALGEYVEEARRLAPEALAMAVLQGFGYTDMSIDFPPATGRQPTLEESRAMAFLAVVRGARVIFWYGPSALRRGDPGAWEDIRTVIGELRRTEGPLSWGERVVELGNPRLQWTARADGGQTWFYIVNPTPGEERVTIPTFGQGALLDALSGGRLGTGSTVSLDLPGYGVVVACTGCRP
jgi:hypothetical protein